MHDWEIYNYRSWNYRFQTSQCACIECSDCVSHGSAGITALGLEKVNEDQADDICGCVYPIDYSKAASLFCGREDGSEPVTLCMSSQRFALQI